ncbi:3'(2'),5'-bisphosphate nucleotidase 1 [Homalodisca vitripennis]|nr:3'(2'),5'-bisphosphate nucleotidase 1 [Homalodisca vitripennis]
MMGNQGTTDKSVCTARLLWHNSGPLSRVTHHYESWWEGSQQDSAPLRGLVGGFSAGLRTTTEVVGGFSAHHTVGGGFSRVTHHYRLVGGFSAGLRTTTEVTVWVDPLDGTSEYTQGLLDHVTVLIGIAVKEKAVAGVIHQPYYNYQNGGELGRTVWGFEGVGVGGFVPTSPPKGQRIITTTRSHSNPVVQATLDALKPDKVLKVGGAGHKVMLLMEGKAHAYVFASGGTKRWDTCAPEAILHAAGGKLTDLHGNTYSYAKDTSHANSGGVLATAHSDEHDIYLKSIPSEVREKLS